MWYARYNRHFILFILYRNGVNDKKFSPNPVNVGFLYVLVLNELLFLEIRISKKAN